jgi:hypothetical protein
MKQKTTSGLFVFSMVFLISCMSNLEYKEAKFNRAPKEVIEELKMLNGFDNANIKWTVSSFGDSVSQNLKVFLTNGENLPKSDSALFEIGKNAMSIVVSSINNESDYNNFIVYFVTRKKVGTMTYGSEKQFEYKLSELEK